MDPVSAVAASIITSVRLFEVTYQLKAVDEQTADLLSTARHVDTNLNEARRLRTKVALLDAGESAWIDGVIEDTDKALRAVAQLIEPARVDKNVKEGINFRQRIMWVFRDNPKVRDKHAGLTLCHQSLMTVIACLHCKTLVIIEETTGPRNEEKPPPYDPQTADLFNWRNRRRRRKSSMDLRDTDTERATPTSSVLTNSVSTTSPASPSSFTTTLSGCSSTTEWFEGTISSLAEVQLKPTSNSLATLQDDPPEPQVLVSSTSTGSAAVSPLSSTVNNNDMDVKRPPPANLDSPRRKPVPHNRRPSDTNDFSPSDRFRATQKSLHNLSSRPPSSPQPRQSILDTDPEHFSSINSFPVLDCSAHAGTSSVICTNQSQTQDSAHTNCSNADTVSMPSLVEISSDPSAIVSTDCTPYDNPHGLKDQQVYKPYRRPTMGQESQSFAVSSTASSPTISSDGVSRSERSHSASQIPAYNPPRFPGDPRYSSRAFSAEIESAFGGSTTGYGELETNGADHDTDKEALPSQTDGSTSARLGRATRGRRSWLVFHATRSDLGHYMG